MKGLIIYNGFLFPKEPSFVGRFREAGDALGIRIEGAKSGDFLLQNGQVDRPECHFCLFFDKDFNLYRALEEKNVRLFNSYYTIAVCDDKALQIRELGGRDFPDTYFSPKCYHRGQTWERLPDIGVFLGYPLIVKECFGSWGEQVYLAEDEAALKRIYAEHSDRPMLFQRLVRESYGRDGRAVVVGGKVIGAVRRKAKPGEFRANVERGATVEPLYLDRETERMCQNVARALKADFCAVDLLFGKDRTYVCEVNASPGFAGFGAATGVSAEEEILRHVLRRLQR